MLFSEKTFWTIYHMTWTTLTKIFSAYRAIDFIKDISSYITWYAWLTSCNWDNTINKLTLHYIFWPVSFNSGKIKGKDTMVGNISHTINTKKNVWESNQNITKAVRVFYAKAELRF